MRSYIRSITAITASLFLFSAAQAQDSDTSLLKLKPTFSLGTGMFAFYGDIGSQHAGYSPLTTRLGYEFRAGLPVTDWLEVSLFALHGTVGANERSTTRNLNFESRVTTGGLMLTYNFHQFLPQGHVIEPFVSVGFESVEFLSKTDLKDAQGRTYHYWDDGTIRDRDEFAADAANAVTLQRDYSFESDVRELDLDGFGKYTERTWAVPVGVGAKVLLGGGFDLRVGTTMHFAFSDLVDGVTDASLGDRQGDAKNDRFLYSSVALSYAIDLNKKKRQRVMEPTLSPEELAAISMQADEDGDGVTDFKDICPYTPAGAKVDERGCPLDGDGDHVPDGLDLEPTTAKGAAVDQNGVTISDAQFLKDYLAYKDSGNVRIDSSRMESLGSHSHAAFVPRSKRYYTVKVGSEVEGITEKQMQQLLSIPDIRTVESGDTISFVVGGYEDIPEALRRQLALKGEGVNGKVVAEEGGALIDVPDEVSKAQAAMSTAPPVNDHHIASSKEKTIVRVQLGAFRHKLSKNIFAGINDLVTLHGDDGLTRYYTGVFTDINEAAKHKVGMLSKGFNGAFLVAFKNGKRVSLKEAGAKLTGPESLKDKAVNGVNKKMVRYKVQLGTFAGNVPSDVMSKFLELKDVTTVTGPEDTRYYYADFQKRADADDAVKAIREKGIPDAFVVGSLNGRIIDAVDADRLLSQP